MVVLDAMGVMYQPGEDFELLLLFAHEMGCTKADAEITGLYDEASRGTMSSAELWRRLGIFEDPEALDRRLVARYSITDGLFDFLRWCAESDLQVACISNDVREWARARALHFGLAESIVSWTISGDVGHRKPDGAIYDAFLSTANADGVYVFVDDRLRNVLAAADKGMRGVLFGDNSADARPTVATAADFAALAGVVEEIRLGS